MKSLRRIAIPALAAGLTAGAGLIAAPAPSANEGSIFVSVLDGTLLLEGVGVTAFGPEEELVISIERSMLTPGERFLHIEMRDTYPRPILADRNTGNKCAFSEGKQGALVICNLSTIRQVRVDFGSLDGATTVAMAEGMTLPLAFNGGAGPDYVQGGAADDWIRGNGGDDFLFGGPGDDYLDGGAGDDSVEGEEGRDDMRGGSGSNSIDAADNTADIRVDCGGLPKFLDFDKELDEPTNCGANPTPIPPAPIEPVDPPAPGQGNGTVDGVPTEVQTKPTGSDNKSVTIEAPQNQIFMNTGLWLGISPNPSPFSPIQFPQTLQQWLVAFPGLFPNSNLNVDIFSQPNIGPTAATSRVAAKPIESVTIRANAAGLAEGNVPVPAGQQPGTFTVQFNAVLASGAAAQINVGVNLTQATPDPDPGPDATITIDSAKRGSGKKASTITVRGTALGLEGTAVTPRYRVQGAKKWTLGTPVTVTDSGSFTLRLSTPKKVRIMMVSGAVRSKAVQVAAVRR